MGQSDLTRLQTANGFSIHMENVFGRCADLERIDSGEMQGGDGPAAVTIPARAPRPASGRRCEAGDRVQCPNIHLVLLARGGRLVRRIGLI